MNPCAWQCSKQQVRHLSRPKVTKTWLSRGHVTWLCWTRLRKLDTVSKHLYRALHPFLGLCSSLTDVGCVCESWPAVTVNPSKVILLMQHFQWERNRNDHLWTRTKLKSAPVTTSGDILFWHGSLWCSASKAKNTIFQVMKNQLQRLLLFLDNFLAIRCVRSFQKCKGDTVTLKWKSK